MRCVPGGSRDQITCMRDGLDVTVAGAGTRDGALREKERGTSRISDAASNHQVSMSPWSGER